MSSHKYRNLLMAALESTDDPERHAQTMLSALVESDLLSVELQEFAGFLNERWEKMGRRVTGLRFNGKAVRA